MTRGRKASDGRFRMADSKREGYVIFTGQGVSVGGRDGHSVPEKYSARIESLQSLREEINHEQTKKVIPRGHSKQSLHVKVDRRFVNIVNVYLTKGWAWGSFHMIELTFKARDVTNEDIAAELAKTHRCYCVDCTDLEAYGKDDDPTIAEVLKVRKAVAEANGIPLDGSAKHETQIDTVMASAEAS